MRSRHAAVIAALTAFAAGFFAPAARAELTVVVDKSSQQMTVSQNGETLYVWPVSTGIARHDTPAGEFKPFRMEKDHFSREWDDAPMPYSIFFTTQGHAIHGTNHRSLGQPASHGCVRLSVAHAATLWALVRHEKMANTHVVLTGEIPQGGQPAVAWRDRDDPPDTSIADDDTVASIPPRRQRVVRGWREYRDGSRYYYYRDRPFFAPPSRYRSRADGPLEFLFRP